MERDWESRRLFLFCPGRLKVIFFIVSKAVASFSQPLMPNVLGGFAAENRGADYVQLLVPSLRARTRSWTGHREPHNQTSFACEAHGAGQHRDSTETKKYLHVNINKLSFFYVGI